VENGRYVCEANPCKLLVRNTYLWLVQLVPAWKRQLEQGARRFGMCRYTSEPGVHFLGDYGGGLLLPQVYSSAFEMQLSQISASNVGFTDDEIFTPTKTGLLQLVALCNNTEQVHEAYKDLESLQGYSDEYFKASEATIIVMDSQAKLSIFTNPPYRTVRVATAEEFAASPLCHNRPAPKFYDELRISKELPGMRYVIVRPDRFVFAAAATVERMIDALKQVKHVLHGDNEDHSRLAA